MHSGAVHIAFMGKRPPQRKPNPALVTKDQDPKTLIGMNQRLIWARLNDGRYPDQAKDAADAMGVVKSTYWGHENGSRGFPKVPAAQYARFYKVDLHWLITGQGDPKIGSLGKRVDQLGESLQEEVENYVDFLVSRRPLAR